MLINLFIFLISLWLIIKGSLLATKYSERLSKDINLSDYTVGFILISIISILPEASISINASLHNVSEFGLGALLGSNIADLALVLPIVVLFLKKEFYIDDKIIKKNKTYLYLLSLPLILGIDGVFSRIDGFILLIFGIIFYYFTFKKNNKTEKVKNNINYKLARKNIFLLLISMITLLIATHFIVISSTNIADILKINPTIIGIIIVGIGAAIPELSFSFSAIKNRDNKLAVGGILGSVMTNSTVVIGILAIINPFSFPLKTIYIVGILMLLSAFLLIKFMKSNKKISYKEAFILLSIYVVFILLEIFTNF